ncbi:MAG TPA: bifunctional diaminohydroxyphosphoribosylaminopyrimidine deaminase/5-amino-6-(5-phosphoribosylamino)uracil reductase RibD, partial [Flavobacteriales bacterium]|nr:bifunctional diaminohydroxyphosphoribosylaminopyrimidine deaminase/5-amino-6-(5-phosphoribosylamino)uracil reductase RibD [Flavobacteriales bacterium]
MSASAGPHDRWMARCLQLARNGLGRTAPNPLVGAVLVQGDRLLAEGWHHELGAPHAEAECLRAFGDAPVPADATMYVSLEPCAHHGRTPPCADLLIARGVKRVVIGVVDPNPLVSGKGIAKLRDAGVEVITGVEEAACRWTNRRFLTAFEQQRPYVILKWAASADGFLDKHPRSGVGVQRISSQATNVLVHRWRSEEQAILVG